MTGVGSRAKAAERFCVFLSLSQLFPHIPPLSVDLSPYQIGVQYVAQTQQSRMNNSLPDR